MVIIITIIIIIIIMNDYCIMNIPIISDPFGYLLSIHLLVIRG